MAAVAKLDLHIGISVLTKLSVQLDSFKERAGFSISQNTPFLMSDLYEASQTMKCIHSWVHSHMPFLSPTWKNFIQILRELKLGDVAAEIDHYIQSTAQTQQQEQIRDSELCMIEEYSPFIACQLC